MILYMNVEDGFVLGCAKMALSIFLGLLSIGREGAMVGLRVWVEIRELGVIC